MMRIHCARSKKIVCKKIRSGGSNVNRVGTVMLYALNIKFVI